MNVGRSPRQTYKALLFDYDALVAKSDDECCYSLSEREVSLLLAQLDYITWKTRYRPTSTQIDKETINKWQGNLARKLMSGCCPDNDELHRYLADGTYQTSTDGGLTWNDDPTGDERYGLPEAPPLPGADSDAKRCAAADNVRAQFVVMRDGLIDLLTAGTTVLLIVSFLVGLVGGILSISVVGVTWGVILFSLAGALLSLTPESVADQIDDQALDDFRCLVYCAMGNDGKIPSDGLPGLLSDIASLFSGFPETFFYSIVASMGVTGINNAGTMGAATASDCASCDCGGCANDWVIVNGTLVGTTENTLTVDSIPAAGSNWVIISRRTEDGGDGGCCFCDAVSISNPNFQTWICNGGSPIVSPVGLCIQRVNAVRSTPFTITFTLNDCP